MIETAAVNLTIREEFTVVFSLLTGFFHYRDGKGVIFPARMTKKVVISI